MIVEQVVVDGGNQQHYCFSGYLFNKTLIPNAFLHVTDVDIKPKYGHLLAIKNTDCQQVLLFTTINYDSALDQADYSNLYNYLQANGYDIDIRFNTTNALDIHEYKKGNIQFLWEFPSNYNYTWVSTQTTGKKVDYDDIMNFARNWIRDKHTDIVIRELNEWEQFEQNVSDVGNSLQQFYEKIGFNNQGYGLLPIDLLQKTIDNFRLTIGFKAVQFNNVFYNIPQRTNISYRHTNQLWAKFPEQRGWHIVVSANLALMPYPFQNIAEGIQQDTEFAESSRISNVFILIHMFGRIQYKGTLSEQVAKGFGTDPSRQKEDEMYVFMRDSVKGISRKTFIWDKTVKENLAMYLTSQISFEQFMAKGLAELRESGGVNQ